MPVAHSQDEDRCAREFSRTLVAGHSSGPQGQLRTQAGPPIIENPARQSTRDETFPVVAIGASAGGLEAYTKLFAELSGETGMAFILVQHLMPGHDSMIVELLAPHTAMAVVQAAEGMQVRPDHLYVTPPGVSLSVARGVLHIAKPTEGHGARLPFDFLLHSVAKAYGRRAICVVLSGTGTDGTLGLAAIKAAGGFVLVQSRKMPRTMACRPARWRPARSIRSRRSRTCRPFFTPKPAEYRQPRPPKVRAHLQRPRSTQAKAKPARTDRAATR